MMAMVSDMIHNPRWPPFGICKLGQTVWPKPLQKTPMMFLASCQTGYRKVRSDLNFVIWKSNFGQHLVGISLRKHFHGISGIMPDRLQKSSIRLEFRHLEIQFRSTFSWNFPPKPLPRYFWHHARPVTEKFDPTRISSFGNVISVNI